MRCFALALGLIFSTFVFAKQSGAPYELTLDEVKAWSPTSSLAAPDNIAVTPLAKRVSAPLPHQINETPAEVLYAPDGMNNFANAQYPLDGSEHYIFNHWPNIDILNWFAGTAEKTVQIPSRAWVDKAHENGVKVLGSVFLAVARWGGNPDTIAQLVEQDEKGRFVYADRLISIAKYYNFDGWLINQETDLTVIKDEDNALVEDTFDNVRGKELANKMRLFMQYLTANSPKNMEVHWYDSMLMNGKVRWQNMLNAENAMFLQQEKRTSDAIFINYWWDETMVDDSVDYAHAIGRSPYDVFMGVDLWPDRNAQRAFSRNEWLEWLFDKATAKTSIALFAPNVNFNFSGNSHTPAFANLSANPENLLAFHNTEQRLFNGDDLNVLTTDTKGFKGVAAWLPAKTTILSLPFSTYFNVGHGKKMFKNGHLIGDAWTDISQQSIPPTWHFAVDGDDIEVNYTFEDAYQGGSALRIHANGPANATVPLYKILGQLSSTPALSVVSKGEADMVTVLVEYTNGTTKTFPLSKSPSWKEHIFKLASDSAASLSSISINVSSTAESTGLIGAIAVSR